MVNWASQDIGTYKKKNKGKLQPPAKLLTREEIMLMEPDVIPGLVILPEDLPEFHEPEVRILITDETPTAKGRSAPIRAKIEETKVQKTENIFNRTPKTIYFQSEKDEGYGSQPDPVPNKGGKHKKDKVKCVKAPKKASFLATLPFRTPKMRDRTKDVFDENDTPDNRALRASLHVKRQHESVTGFLSDVVQYQASCKQRSIADRIVQAGGVEKLRHSTSGSYPPNSVDEKLFENEREHILRYAWKGRAMKMRALLKNPAHWKDINRIDNCLRTATHFAASWGDHEILGLLADIPRVDLNMRDDEGKTPLYKATEAKSLECIKILLQFGANPLVAAQDNRTPFDYALQNVGDTDLNIILTYIFHGVLMEENKHTQICTALHRICFANVPIKNTAEALLSAGVNINVGDCKGVTPLMLAAQADDVELVRIFINAGADPNFVDIEHNDVINYCDIKSPCYKLCFKAINSYADLTEEEEYEAAFSLMDPIRAQHELH